MQGSFSLLAFRMYVTVILLAIESSSMNTYPPHKHEPEQTVHLFWVLVQWVWCRNVRALVQIIVYLHVHAGKHFSAGCYMLPGRTKETTRKYESGRSQGIGDCLRVGYGWDSCCVPHGVCHIRLHHVVLQRETRMIELGNNSGSFISHTVCILQWRIVNPGVHSHNRQDKAMQVKLRCTHSAVP